MKKAIQPNEYEKWGKFENGMNREEAKEKLYMEWQKFLEDNIDYAGISEAYKMAIQALEQEHDAIHNEREQAYMKGYEDASKRYRTEPCEDAISRQAAIGIIQNWLGSDTGYSWGEKNVMKCTIDELRGLGLPSVSTEKTGWIPVSERLPEVNKRVLVTSYGRVCYAMMISADGNSGYPIFKLQDSLNEKVVCETTVHSEWTTSRITAWMPLPTPYEPQEISERNLKMWEEIFKAESEDKE